MRSLDCLQTIDGALGLCRLPGELLGLVDLERADVLVGLIAHGSLGLGFPLLRPLTLTLRSAGERTALRLIRLELLMRLLTSPLPLSQIRLPSATEHGQPMGVLLDLGNIGHHPVEESMVMAHQQHRGVEPEHPPLEMREPIEIEVIGRLIEEVHIETRQQQGREPRPRRLPA